jgi:preprotein translocase subunit Sss1
MMASNLQVVILTILFIGTMGMVIYTVSDMLEEIRKEEKQD